MKILIALDASIHSQRALEFVTRTRWPAGSRVIVASVVQPIMAALAMPYEPALPPELEEERRRVLTEAVTRSANTLRESGFPTEERIEDGDPRQALIQLARDEGVDLIVVGSHGRSGFSKLVLGSVSSHVVTHAPCSVLVVKQSGNH